MNGNEAFLRLQTLHIAYFTRAELADHLEQIAAWTRSDASPIELPDWLLVRRDNKGGGGPCQPTQITVQLPLVLPNKIAVPRD